MTDSASFLDVNYLVFEGAAGLAVPASKGVGTSGDIQCATGYIVTGDRPIFGSPTDEMSNGKLLKEIKVPRWLNCITEVSGSFKAGERGTQSPEHRVKEHPPPSRTPMASFPKLSMWLTQEVKGQGCLFM